MSAAAPVAITVPPAFKKLVSIIAGMFYAGQCPPSWWVDAADPKPEAPDAEKEAMQADKKAAQLLREAKRKAQQDTTGLGVILLTALTEEQWVEEDDFARKLNLPAKMVRKALRYLEQEQLLQREHRKESVRLRKQEREMQIKAGLRPAPGAAAAAAAAAASAADAAAGLPPEEDEAIVSKGHIISYCALDYPRIVDSVRLRLHDIKAQLKQNVTSNNVVQRYKCSAKHCGKQYTSMDVLQLLPSKEAAERGCRDLLCAVCGAAVEMFLDEKGHQTGNMEQKKENQRKAKRMLQTIDAELAPLTTQLAAVQNISPPDFLSYATWLANQAAVKQRWDAMEADKARGNITGSKRKHEPTYDINTQVVVSIADSTPGSNGQDAGLAGAVAAAAAGAGAGRAGGVGAARSSGLPPALGRGLAGAQQAPAAKPIPPWLMSKHKAATAAAAAGGGLQQQEQRQSSTGLGLGMAFKSEAGGLDLKPGPGLKLEGIKVDPGLKADPDFKQEDDLDDWEDVAAPGSAAAGNSGQAGLLAGVPAGTSSQGGLLGSVPDDDEEDWEDVL